MLRGELGRFSHSALIAASSGRGTRAGQMCLGAARPNCSHLSRPRRPGGERSARKRLGPQSERQGGGIDGRPAPRPPLAVNPRARRLVNASRLSRVPAAPLRQDAAGPSCRGRAVPRLPGPIQPGPGRGGGGGSPRVVGVRVAGEGTARSGGEGGAEADGAPTPGRAALAGSLAIPSLPLLTSPPSPVHSSPLILSIFLLPTFHLSFRAPPPRPPPPL